VTGGSIPVAGFLGASVLPLALMHKAAGEVEVLSVVRDVAAIVKRTTKDPAYRVVLFGSWASGTPRTRSDIDIGVQGPQRIDPVTLQAIRAACDALPTLYTIDLVDLAVLSPTIREAALSNAIAVDAG
jgi:predicted nucleotidyltransferase